MFARLQHSLRKSRSCTGKRRYDTRTEAKEGMRMFARMAQHGYLDSLRVYRCDFCGHYHFGHRPRALVMSDTIPC